MPEIFNLFKDREPFPGLEAQEPATFSVPDLSEANETDAIKLAILKTLAEGIIRIYESHAKDVLQRQAGKYKINLDEIFKRDILKASIRIEQIAKIRSHSIKDKLQGGKDEDFILVFQLPAALSFSYKFKRAYQDLSCFLKHRQRIKSDAFCSSELYGINRDTIWALVNSLNETLQKEGMPLKIERVNDVGEHNGDYYYIFKIVDTANPASPHDKKERRRKKKAMRRKTKQALRPYLLR